MNASAIASSMHRSAAARAILSAGLVCGAMDITAAFLVYGYFGARPIPLLQGIAAGLLGRRSFSGGLATAALGLLCHFFIAFLAAVIYFGVSRAVPFLVEHAVISGILYGPIVYFFMQLVVLPLSRAVRRPFSMELTVIGVIIHIICVGLPIALLIRRSSIQ
jgi:hypothetical protein